MYPFPEKLQKKIVERKQTNSLRIVSDFKNKIDFSSNDYLGFSRNKTISKGTLEILKKFSFTNGSTGSRLVSGTHMLHEIVEKKLSEFHNTEAALLFNSGYDANLGLFSSILQKGDTVLYDELIHASIRDGIRLSNAKSYKFKHNSLKGLEKIFSKCEGNIYIAVESIYSMDGDTAPLKEIANFSKKHKCYLIVDEAHSNGVFGTKGKGLVQELNLENDVFARVHTFGKALGCHGAVVLGSQELRDYLINFSRSFIYTTAASIHSIAVVYAAYQELENTDAIEKLKNNIQYFNTKISTNNLHALFIESTSAIHCCILSGNDKVKAVSKKLQTKGFDIKPILTPTVPKGEERLRICLHSYNTLEEIEELIRLLSKFV
jgi:8-amino-7-oxononanoate synthase